MREPRHPRYVRLNEFLKALHVAYFEGSTMWLPSHDSLLPLAFHVRQNGVQLDGKGRQKVVLKLHLIVGVIDVAVDCFLSLSRLGCVDFSHRLAISWHCAMSSRFRQLDRIRADVVRVSLCLLPSKVRTVRSSHSLINDRFISRSPTMTIRFAWLGLLALPWATA